MELREIIKKIRTDNKIKQADLAREIGVPQSTLSKYESGDLRIDSDTLPKIANALGVSIDTLYGINEDDSLGTRMAKYRNNNIPPEDMNLGKCLDEIDEKTILDDFHRLNFRGKKEAIKRMSELTKLDEYTNKEGE